MYQSTSLQPQQLMQESWRQVNMDYLSISTPPITSTQTTATASATTTSTTDVLMTSMTVTPIAGTYFVIFTGVVQQNTAGSTATVSIYSNAVQDTASVQTFAPFDGGALSSGQASCVCVTHGVYTVNGSQAIAIQWHVSAGTGTVFQRKLTVLKIG